MPTPTILAETFDYRRPEKDGPIVLTPAGLERALEVVRSGGEAVLLIDGVEAIVASPESN